MFRLLPGLRFRFYFLILILSPSLTQGGIDSLLSKLKNSSGEERVDLLNALAKETWQFYPDDAIKYAGEAKSLSRKLNYKHGLATSLNYIALGSLEKNDISEAEASIEGALKLFTQLNDISGIAETYLNKGDLFRQLNLHDSSEYYMKLSLEYFTKAGNENGKGMAHANLGLMYWRKGLNEDALRHFYAAYNIRTELGLKKSAAMSLNNIGTIYWRFGDYQKALDVYSESLKLRIEINDSRGQIVTKGNIGLIYQKLKNYDMAETLYREMLQESKSLEYLFGLAYSNHNLGLLHLEKGEYDSSIIFSRDAVKYYHMINEFNAVAHSLSYLGSAYYGKGDVEKAMHYYNAAIDTALQANDNYSLALTYQSFAKLLINQNKISEAEQYLQKAFDLAQKEKLTDLITEHYLLYSNLYKKKGDVKKAFEFYTEYVDTKEHLRIEQLNNQLSNWQVQHETNKKERENKKLREDNALKQAELDNQKRLFNLLIIILFFALFGFVVSILYFRLKKRTNQKIVEQKEELEYLNRELEKKNLSLEESNQSKNKLFSIISHDLRSPFQSIIGLTDVLLTERHNFTEEEITEFLGSISRSGRNLLNLTNNILDWSRIQMDKITVTRKNVRLGDIFNRAVEAYSQYAQKKNISVIIKSGSSLELHTDEDILATIIRNLLANSIKFSLQNGEVCIGAENIHDSVNIYVEDNGIGISEEDVSKLFDIKNNFSTPGTENEKGTGIGLIICKEFAEKLGGNITISSIPGRGTKISLSLHDERKTVLA